MEISSVKGACTQTPLHVRVLQLFFPKMSGSERQTAWNAIRALVYFTPLKSCPNLG